jgi:hypothetical protein
MQMTEFNERLLISFEEAIKSLKFFVCWFQSHL